MTLGGMAVRKKTSPPYLMMLMAQEKYLAGTSPPNEIVCDWRCALAGSMPKASVMSKPRLENKAIFSFITEGI